MTLMIITKVLCPGPWASELLAKIGLKLPLVPWKIPVYYWRVSQFLPHTFIYDSGQSRAGHVWGLPEQEYPGLVKVREDEECDCDSKTILRFVFTRARCVTPTRATRQTPSI